MKTNTKQLIAVILAILMTLFAFAAAVLWHQAVADSPYLVDPGTGKYLGSLNSNRFDPNSVSNPYGKYGSRYSADSINNSFGKYGSRYSNSSPNNPYATAAPIIIHRNH